MKDFLINLVVADYAIGLALFVLIMIVAAVAWFKDGITGWCAHRRISQGPTTHSIARCRFCEDQTGGCPVCMPRRRGR